MTTTRLLIAAFILLSACNAPSSTTADLAITSVNVVDVVSGEVLADRTVTVAEGRIVEVAPAAEALRAGDAARVIDGAGRYLIPGLWDAHVHFRGGTDLAEENRALLPLYVANGITMVRDAGGDLTEALLEWRQAIDAGQMMGPRILTSGPKLDGPNPSWEGSIALSAPAEVSAAIDSLEAIGVDYVKIYDGSIPADIYLEIIRETESRDLIVSGHMPFSVRFLDAVEAGLDATDHLYYAYKGISPLEDSVTVAVQADDLSFWNALYLMVDGPPDPALEQATWDVMVEHGIVVVPTLHIGNTLSQLDVDDHQDDPELRFIDPAVEETYARRVRSFQRSSEENRQRQRALRATLAAVVPRMRDAGVTIVAGSDAGPFNSYVYPGFALHSELEALVDAGLTPAEALRAATVNPAARWRLSELGQVAEGFLADLVLLEANPLEDITNTRGIAMVILRGRDVLDAAQLQALLDEVSRPTQR